MVAESPVEDTRARSEEPQDRNVTRILKVELPVSVIIDEKEVTLEYVLDMGPGAIIEFEKATDEALDIVVGGKKIGRGEVVKVGENFGIVVREIGDVRERVEQLGSLQQE